VKVHLQAIQVKEVNMPPAKNKLNEILLDYQNHNNDAEALR